MDSQDPGLKDSLLQKIQESRALNYLLICWGLALLLTIIFHGINPKRGPILIHFDPSQVISIEVHTLERWSERKIIIPINSKTPPLLTLYESRLLDLDVTTINQQSPLIKIGRMWDNQPLAIKLFSSPSPTNKDSFSQSYSKWNAPALGLEYEAVGFAHFSGLYMAFVILLSAGYGLIALFSELRKNRWRLKSELVFSSLLVLIFGYLAHLNWPGHLSFDTPIDYQVALMGMHNPSTLMFYSAIHYALVLICRSMASGMILNLVLAIGIFTTCFSYFRKDRINHLLFSLGFVFFLASNINQQLLVFQNRDITFSWVFVAFLASVSLRNSSFLVRISLFLISFLIRKETLFLLPLLMVYEKFRSPKPWAENLKSFAIPALIIMGYLFGTPYNRKIQMDPVYTITSYINPMMAILSKHGRQILSPNEVRDLEGILDIDRAISIHKAHDIDEYHQHAVRRAEISEKGGEDRLRRVALRLFWDYPLDFLKNRIEMASVILGIRFDTYWFNNEAFENPLFKQLQLALPTHVQNNGAEAWRAVTHCWDSYRYRIIFASCVPAILILGFSLLFWRRYPLTSTATLMMLTRTLVVLTFAPAGYYKYVWSLAIWGAMFPAFAWYEYQSRKANA